MKKLIPIALVLSLFLGLAACAKNAPPAEEAIPTTMEAAEAMTFDTASYEQILEAYGGDPAKIEAAIAPLRSFAGDVSDGAIVAFLQYLDSACQRLSVEAASMGGAEFPFTMQLNSGEGYMDYFADYEGIAAALEGKLSEASAQLLGLLEKDTVQRPFNDGGIIIPWDDLLARAKAWTDFETRFPEFAAGFNSIDTRALVGGRAAAYLKAYREGLDNTPPFEWGTDELLPELRDSMDKFLADPASELYPFYNDIKSTYDKWIKR